MVKEIELYKDKKIVIDFDKVEKYICNLFAIFLFIIYCLIINYQKGLGVVSFKHIIFMVVSSVSLIVLVATNILQKKWKVTKYHILLGIYFLLICISSATSEYGSKTIFGTDGRGEGVIPILCYMICFYIFFKIFSYNEKIFDFITATIIVLSCYGIIQSLISDTYTFLGGYENMGYSKFGNPNMFSSFLNLFFPIYLVKYFCDDKEWEFNICVVGIIFAGIICSRTFGGYITAAICFIVLSVYFIIINRFKKDIFVKFGKLVTAFFIIFMILNISNDNAYLNEIMVNKTEINQSIKDNSANKFGNYRGFIWKMSLDIISKHPMFGVGPDSLGSEVRKNYMDRADYILEDTLVDKAHNEYLHIAVTTGIPSLIVYSVFIMTILVGLLLRFIKYVKQGKILDKNTIFLVAVASSIASYLIQAFGNISVISVAPLFWAILGIGAKIATDND